MFQFPGLAPLGDRMTPAGFPHSDISGSMLACSSPKLIAACHVFHRRSVPRHPPYALNRLTSSSSTTAPKSRVRCPHQSTKILIPGHSHRVSETPLGKETVSRETQVSFTSPLDPEDTPALVELGRIRFSNSEAPEGPNKEHGFRENERVDF